VLTFSRKQVMNHRTAINELTRMGRQLSQLPFAEHDEIAAAGFVVGAIYALHRATMLEYSDDRNKSLPPALQAEFGRAAQALGKDESPEQIWLAGFYFSSGLMRVAALNERLDKMANRKRDIALQVRRVVNKLKHEPDAHVRGDWTILFGEVVELTGKLLNEFEAIINSRRPTH
jgi:hypothetical protein